jgi:hypothetical protein
MFTISWSSVEPMGFPLETEYDDALPQHDTAVKRTLPVLHNIWRTLLRTARVLIYFKRPGLLAYYWRVCGPLLAVLTQTFF